MASAPGIHLAVALEGAGWHSAAWREPRARPGDLFTAGYWTDLVTEAERGLLDFVTIEDSLGVRSSHEPGAEFRADRVPGRLDAVLVASRVAPRTDHIGLVPTGIVTHTEPFHLSKAIATLDYVSRGRGGWRAQVARRPADAAHFGRRDPGVLASEDLLAEAGDYIEVVRRLWDSWEDDAEIRDVATGRFIDRDKLHYIDFAGEWFSVKGPSITPRPPQGQPLVTVLAHAAPAYRLAQRSADVVFVTPRDAGDARAIERELRPEGEGGPRVFADLVVFLGDTAAEAARRRDRLDERAGEDYSSDALVFTGTAGELADLVLEWAEAGLSGFRLRPAALPDDLETITRRLVPELQLRGVFRTDYAERSLRERLGLARPTNRYAEV
ncbi:LLM class flavin-dependent oxidoreductase [Prauserella cavernicola]|uniref:LLM class flavin-dependent oxidoreductase n=1 Tax=Prauserella cavernicola TaxID=2800127 RepID=A0A934QNH6_9PSEU|nr:LLM class flavin-dependent oxidoreductase [Prauserella cavernicola]MBK1783182.1 LLM class flavin-dependent oxidoreductase [Prauserella cavernicola]